MIGTIFFSGVKNPKLVVFYFCSSHFRSFVINIPNKKVFFDDYHLIVERFITICNVGCLQTHVTHLIILYDPPTALITAEDFFFLIFIKSG